jgi:hypothetical protein
LVWPQRLKFGRPKAKAKAKANDVGFALENPSKKTSSRQQQQWPEEP